MTLDIKLSQEDEATLLNAVALCKRISNVGGCRMATLATLAVAKLNDVLSEAKATEVEGAPF